MGSLFCLVPVEVSSPSLSQGVFLFHCHLVLFCLFFCLLGIEILIWLLCGNVYYETSFANKIFSINRLTPAIEIQWFKMKTGSIHSDQRNSIYRANFIYKVACAIYTLCTLIYTVCCHIFHIKHHSVSQKDVYSWGWRAQRGNPLGVSSVEGMLENTLQAIKPYDSH